VPVRQRDFKASAVRLIFGSNQGEIRFSDLTVLSVQSLPVQFTADNLKDSYSFILQAAKTRRIYEQKPLAQLAYHLIPADYQTGLDNREMEAIDNRQFEPVLNINNIPSLKKIDEQIRTSISSNKAFSRNGQWYYAENKPFTPVGFTIVGETFNRWLDARRKEFTNKTAAPYWAKNLSSADAAQLVKVDFEKYMGLFMKSQAKNWQGMGCNLIRVHQRQSLCC